MHPPSTSPVQVVRDDLSQDEESVSGDGGPCTSIPLRMLAGSRAKPCCCFTHTCSTSLISGLLLDFVPRPQILAPKNLDVDTLAVAESSSKVMKRFQGPQGPDALPDKQANTLSLSASTFFSQLCCRPHALKIKGRHVGRCFRWLRVKNLVVGRRNRPSQVALAAPNLTALKS